MSQPPGHSSHHRYHLSLRLRLALWSAALAGGALLGFALLSSWLIYQAKLDRLDARLGRTGPLARPDGPGGNRGALSPDPEAALPPNPEAILAQDLGLATDAEVGLLLVNRTGTVVYQSPHWPGSIAPLAPPDLSQDLSQGQSQDQSQGQFQGRSQGRLWRGPHRLMTVRTADGPWRLSVRATPMGQVAIAVNLAAVRQEMATLRRIYLLTIPGLLLAIGGGAWTLAGQALQPVRQLSQSIDRVTAQGLAQRLPANPDPEFAPLILAFNAMLERLERSFHQASRFSGDAAHELKTPLTILQGELEQAIQQVEPGSPAQQTLGQLLAQVHHLGSIVRKLLLLSLADAGQMSILRQPVDFSALVQDQLEDLSLLAPDLAVRAEIEPGLVVAGDRDLLVQVVQNLITNAAKYNLPQGWVRVQAHRQPQQVHLTLANATVPLTATAASHLFDRFYRGETARTHPTEGLGLGLSLAREIARAHGGDLVLAPSPPGEAHFSLHLPIYQPTRAQGQRNISAM
ncbi:sensor histidine kinase [Nodosilinea nodulosa]|uniref:sensor histidine kinase n=1 Tax=Nodosilinea nodulosa TaxID=416001 RepID=UPI0002EE3D0A|nr:ATP-binding protein [Nodosilinea nodulosa]